MGAVNAVVVRCRSSAASLCDSDRDNASLDSSQHFEHPALWILLLSTTQAVPFSVLRNKFVLQTIVLTHEPVSVGESG